MDAVLEETKIPIVLKFEFTDEFGYCTKMEKSFMNYPYGTQLNSILMEIKNFLLALGFDEATIYESISVEM